ncbi:DUF6059 family protein [Streptomyces sp. NPDC004232]|uniref:DUF6059 family protein n=1 Tax=Streptomyces sp. NPDC004232 TaxID=3154454 RepID=UPI0033BF9BDB
MNGLLHTCRRLVCDLLPRTLWRCLTAYGSFYLTPVPEASHLLSVLTEFGYVTQHAPQSMPDPLAAGLIGLPDGHPERLAPDVPLTEQERLLASEVWAARRPKSPMPPRPPHRRRGRSPR